MEGRRGRESEEREVGVGEGGRSRVREGDKQ